jgi:transcription antitermination factor NusG
LPIHAAKTLDDAAQFPWFALRVRSNCEVMASQVLQLKGFPVYLPLHRTRRQWSDRTKESETPLFPGYTFCRFDPRHKLPILNTAGVASILQSTNGPIPVDEAEIDSVRTLLTSGLPVGPWPFLHAGQLVLVERGPLSGMEGMIVNIKNQHRLVVSLSLLQRSVATEIDRAWVRPLPPHA